MKTTETIALQVQVPIDTFVTALVKKILEERPATTPRVGYEWPGQGGIYAGIVRGDKGEPDYHLIVATNAATELKWDQANKFAADLLIDGHQDFTLPKRKEQSILFGNVPELFEKEYYWSGEQPAAHSDSAWCQGFYGGYQDNFTKSAELRARAVRRLIIQ